jgi:hypothetical protein
MKPNKRSRKQLQLLKELESSPLVERACKKVGIARSTYYRWCESNPAFHTEAEAAQTRGREKLTDFVESKLLENINSNQHAAIAFWLSHNTSRYRTYPHRAYNEEIVRLKRLERMTDEITDALLTREGYESLLQLTKRAREELNKGSNNRFNKV